MTQNHKNRLIKYGALITLIRAAIQIRRRVAIFVSSIVFKMKLRAYGCEYGLGLRVHGNIHIESKKNKAIKIGANLKLNSAFTSNMVGITNPCVLQIIEAGNIHIGDNCGFTSTIISSRSSISIGSNVKIGANTRILDHDYHSLDHLARRDSRKDSDDCKSIPIRIEDDVFIGTNVHVLKGVHVGARSIIGAGSVVSIKEIPPDSLVAGNPAKIIKTKISRS